MDQKLLKYRSLSNIFKKNGFSLFLVGGTVRDYLLNIPLTDIDLVTDATPEEMKEFLTDADFTFSKMGYVKYTFENQKFDITTLRKESEYIDYRHPSKIKFVKELKEDYVRRDFTINALYMDSNLNVIDFIEGQKDVENHILKMIGDPQVRLKEDPLRILRAIRFSLMYNLIIDSQLEKAMKDNVTLLKNLNEDKIKQELKKIKDVSKDDISNSLNYFSIKELIKVLD